MKRRLQIAVSVFFAVLTVALCVSWTWSYRHQVFVGCPLTNQYAFTIFSGAGNVQMSVSNRQYPEIEIESAELDNQSVEVIKQLLAMDANNLGIRRNGMWVSAPYWLYAVLFATFAAIPWASWRFSLRTLLIGITLIAVLLGLVCYAVR